MRKKMISPDHDNQCTHTSLRALGQPINLHRQVDVYTSCHKPMYWPVTNQYRATLLKGKQGKDVSNLVPNWFRPGQAARNSCGHSLTQVSEYGNKLNQAWKSCTTTG